MLLAKKMLMMGVGPLEYIDATSVFTTSSSGAAMSTPAGVEVGDFAAVGAASDDSRTPTGFSVAGVNDGEAGIYYGDYSGSDIKTIFSIGVSGAAFFRNASYGDHAYSVNGFPSLSGFNSGEIVVAIALNLYRSPGDVDATPSGYTRVVFVSDSEPREVMIAYKVSTGGTEQPSSAGFTAGSDIYSSTHFTTMRVV